ncbi:MAG TPA: glycosyltransferase family A protein [Terriglobales bacterium]|nr:glycosyltransferase family A protein [Terriglobales bacterium]
MKTSINKSYVLVTAAYNEERFIAKTIESVVSQTVRPKKWIIVSDGSTDQTDSIVDSRSRDYDFIRLHRICDPHPRNFAAQVNAINAGYALLKDLQFDFFGNVDADVSFAPSYYEQLLAKFEEDTTLGLGGGCIHEEINGAFLSRRGNSTRAVAHAIQLFRRECYEMVGPYVPLPYGGPDWVAEVVARHKGWRVRSFTELPVHHYRPTCSAGGLIRGRYRQGLMDHSLGCDPVFEVFKCLSRLSASPFLIGALARFSGFVWASCRRFPPAVPRDISEFLKAEQRARVRSIFRSIREHAS